MSWRQTFAWDVEPEPTTAPTWRNLRDVPYPQREKLLEELEEAIQKAADNGEEVHTWRGTWSDSSYMNEYVKARSEDEAEVLLRANRGTDQQIDHGNDWDWMGEVEQID